MPDVTKFAIGFDHRDRPRLFELWAEVLDSEQWSEGAKLKAFEERWSEWNKLESVGLSSWAGGALAALEFAGVEGETVLCPSNTFMATPLAAIGAGARVEFVDCRRDDLCMSFEDFERKAEQHKPKAAILVHVGGHLAFDSAQIAEYCHANSIFLLEDCAHAHGADWNGARPGSFGDAGVYSLYATKTVSSGEGGVLVSADQDLLEYTRKFRNYGKFDHQVDGLNFRMNEFTAAVALVGTERMEEIVEWKNEYAREHLDPVHPAKLELPDGMTSGLYKYIVFEEIEKSTGKVYDQPCHRIMGRADELPNTDWVAENHWCVPLYYRPESRAAALGKEA
ncbi:MAG: DegT/DnrJ/EryC1/StrS family aminotransferase [Actinobacteria bacterium]|nr:DegT/DnrJ/EryC1/StrS family aminotransferase [Actinomycetota bacterium]